MKKSVAILAASAMLFSGPHAMAHPGYDAGVAAGFLHPFLGVDHFFALACLGVLASQLAPVRAIAILGAFLAAFTLAFGVADNGISLPAQETVLALSLLGMGALVMLGRRCPFTLSLGVTAVFAAYHGAAHGSELGGFATAATLGGFFLAGLMLTGSAYAVGRQLSYRTEKIVLGYRTAAAYLTSCTGLLLLSTM